MLAASMRADRLVDLRGGSRNSLRGGGGGARSGPEFFEGGFRVQKVGGNRPPLFLTPKKVRGCQILNIVIVVRLAIKNLEESDCLVVVNIKNLTFYRLKL